MMTKKDVGFDVVIKVERSLLRRLDSAVMLGINPFTDIITYNHYREWDLASRVAGRLQDVEGINVSVSPHNARECMGVSILDPELEKPLSPGPPFLLILSVG